MTPKTRVKIAWVLVIASLLGWPVSALTVAKNEPQFVLALSWLAITLTAADILSTQDVRKTQDDQGDDGADGESGGR